ncbi:MAG: NADH-quinone oxidoreductase subunit NuoD [Mucilaginibacter sp.]|nr:MAG: NADH-quinone oxidoreductase subunit NuoD [Mucilaginibacter sp.]PMP64996.1 MAG: NADH-quinone oxidoreductase subunit NuoD [Mucilaginibacter sp.]HEK19134.1 NADH-quinone oxidoreductase subunit D [Bacteroidota bacterium]
MSFDEIKELLLARFGNDVIIGEERNGLQPALLIRTESIADVCLELRDNPSTYFDLLNCLSGVDYGTEANKFGVVYHLTSIPYHLSITLKVSVENNRDELRLPTIPTISHVYATADWHEREAYDLVGIYFEEHPDLRRILLPDDWEGYPLRKDYIAAEYYKGIKIDYPVESNNPAEKITYKTPFKPNPKYSEALKRYEQKIADAAVEDMVLNMGPQHPSTHGVLRLELITDGEIVKEVIPHMGYLHRCFEKHAESLTYQQTIPFTDRMDYLSSMTNAHAWAMGVERMLGIDQDIPKRIEYIRVLVSELNRISSHLIAIGTYGIDIGAFTPFLWCFRDREHIMGMLEWASGSRMLYNYIWVGGLFYDLPVGFEERCREFVDYFKPKMAELNQLLTDNQIFISRTANVGILPLDVAINYGCTGPVLRGSGLRYDLRRIDGYSVYPELDFEVPIGKGAMGTTGDCWDRYKVRVDEIEQSLYIIEQCLDRLQKELKRTPDFDPRAKLPRKLTPKAQDYYFRAEGSKGELGFYFIHNNERSEIPFRVKARGPSYNNLSVVPAITKGVMIADVIAIIGSIDFVLGEVDR